MRDDKLKKVLDSYGIAIFKCDEKQAFNSCLSLTFDDPKNKIYFCHRKNFALVIKFKSSLNN